MVKHRALPSCEVGFDPAMIAGAKAGEHFVADGASAPAASSTVSRLPINSIQSLRPTAAGGKAEMSIAVRSMEMRPAIGQGMP
jgi:hypothetical protein